MRACSRPRNLFLLWAAVPSIEFTACSSPSSSPISTAADNIRVERAVAAPLSAVKTWVLKTDPDIQWATWSEALANTPLDERVGVCVYSKVDESSFTPAPGTNTPEPSPDRRRRDRGW
jgi:hypothetical protein